LLLAEYRNKDKTIQYPFMQGADDYLKQAADPTKWPQGIVYDPEGDGKPIGSLGVYEHWNGVATKQYSRNLGTGTGIELKSYTALAVDNYVSEKAPTATKSLHTYNYKIYPSVFSQRFTIETGSNLAIKASLYNLQGQKVFQQTVSNKYTWTKEQNAGVDLAAGTYILQLKEDKSNTIIGSCKLIKQ